MAARSRMGRLKLAIQRLPRGLRNVPCRIESAEAESLQELLNALASLLVDHGVTAREFGELSRKAFVNAAAAKSRLKNGKVNRSRVAARTGLSRADVGRLLRGLPAASRAPHAPLERVLAGWRENKQFTDRFGRPRPLKIPGKGTSFATLAAIYAKDLPRRAVLDELISMGAVRTQNGVVTMNARRVQPRDNLFFDRVTRTIRQGLNPPRKNR
jgi:Family of unknown function (DUF6502)